MDTASKNVQFVLQTVVDQNARATVLSFATELKRAQDSLKGFTDATVVTLGNANREINETLHGLSNSRAALTEEANSRIIRSETATATSVKRSTGMSAEAYQSLQGQMRNMRREMYATAAESTASLMQVARGMMSLGLVGEEDLEKVARGLVRIQSMFDIVSGGTRVLLGLEKVMHLYRAATQLATVAQEGLNASMIQGQVISGTGLLSGLGGAVSGVAGRVRGLFTSKAATDAAAAAAAAEAGRSAAYLGTSAAAGASAPASRAAGGFLAGTILGRAVPAMGMLGIGAAAAGGAAFGGYAAYDAVSQARMAGVGGGARPGSFTDWIGGASMNPFGWLPENILGSGYGGGLQSRLAAQQSQRQTERMEARSGSLQQLNADDYARLEQSGSSLQASMQSAQDNASAIFRNSLETMKTEEKRAAVATRLAETERDSARLKAQAGQIEERFTAEKVGNELALRASRQEEIDLLNQQVAIEKQLGEEKKAAAREKLSAETETLSKMEAQLKLSKDQLLSARERFALMNEGDQMSITQLAGRLKSGAQMSSEELGKLGSFRELGGVKEAYDAELERRAKAGGFDKAFGGVAQAAIDAAEQKTKAQREIVASLKTEINVTIDADTKKITDELTTKVGEKLKALGDEIRVSVSRLEADVTDIKQRIQNRANGP